MKKMFKSVFVVMIILMQCIQLMATSEPNNVISAGNGTTFAVKKDGSLWAYGNTVWGQLGVSTSEECIQSPVKVMDNVKSVVNGSATTFAVKADDTLWGWGRNSGNYGNGTTKDSDVPIKLMDDVKLVASSDWYTIIIKNDGSLWATGLVPGKIPGLDGSTITTFTQIMQGETFKYISVNGGNVFVINEKDELWGFGENNYGTLGLGHSDEVSLQVKIMNDVAYIASDNETAMIVTLNGSLYVTGSGYNGRFYDGTKVIELNSDTGYVLTPLKIMDNVLYCATESGRWWVVKRDNTLWAWGSDAQFGVLKNYTTDLMIPTKISDQVAAISLGSRHVVVLKKDQTLWTAGQNATGGIAGHEAAYKSYSLQQDMSGILDAPDSWAVKEVNEAIDKGLIPSELQKDYTKPITRQEFAKLVVTMIEKKSGITIQEFIQSKGLTLPVTSPFTDVNDPFVTAAYTLTIVNGVGNNKYDPTKTINRQEAAKMLTSTATALGYATTAPVPVFDDSAQISTWAQPYIGYMVNIGVMKGASNRFDPKGTYVRQMAFITMNRIFLNLK